MRVAALALLLAVPACLDEPADTSPDANPDPPTGDCGIPQLRVRGDVHIDITRTTETEGCPYIYGRSEWRFVGSNGPIPIDTDDAPIVVDSSSVGDGYEEVPVAIALTDEWGIGPTSDDLHNIRAPVVFDLVFDSQGAITGIATATIPWNDATCVVTYAATGSFTPVFE